MILSNILSNYLDKFQIDILLNLLNFVHLAAITNCMIKTTTILLTVLIAYSSAYSRQYFIENITEFNNIKAGVKAGDSIIFKNNTWNDASVELSVDGTISAPVYLLPQIPGAVIFSGSSSLKISGTYIIADGFVFKNINGEKGGIVEFRTDRNILANYCRVTNCVFDNCNPISRLTETNWIILYGQNNRFDHNTILNKKNLGTTLIVQLNDTLSQNNHHRIDHNYFGPKLRGGSNGAETIRIGISTFSRTSSKTIVEENYFERCNGEVEIISVKSCDNILRKNTFYECEGGLVLRHGNQNIVEDNYFIGNDKIHTGGVRVINKGHKIYRNVFIHCAGERFRSAFSVLNGVPNSPINRYDQVKDVTIADNIFIDCKNIELCAGKDFERTARPEGVRFINNLIYCSKVQTNITVNDQIDGFTFSNNVTNSLSKFPANSFKKISIKSSANNNSWAVNYKKQQVKLAPFATKINSGVQWNYAMESPSLKPGKIIKVSPGENSIAAIVMQASANDTLELQAGETYLISKPLVISKLLTIKGNHSTLQFAGENSINFFEIENGGSLFLDGLMMNGTSANGVAASFISAGKKPMIEHYQFSATNCSFTKLTDGHKFVFVAGKGSFADIVSFTNCIFDDITGDVINIAAEKDDIGRYNAEYVKLNNCLFNKVLHGTINVYRGGNDESTTGPYFQMDHCTFNQCSNTELGYVIKLFGVQYSAINNCVFNNSGRAGRSVWYEDYGWTKHSLNHCDFFEAGKITSFYPGIVGKNIFHINPKIDGNFTATNPVLLKLSSQKSIIGYKN
ncbi:hypothetical protein BH11BAC3_BH11BAC3_15350 [soil metagenome]